MRLYIQLSGEEKHLAESYAKLHSMSLGEAFKKALFEKIEDEFDAAVVQEAYTEHVDGGQRSRPISELWKEVGL